MARARRTRASRCALLKRHNARSTATPRNLLTQTHNIAAKRAIAHHARAKKWRAHGARARRIEGAETTQRAFDHTAAHLPG
eukprot:6471520-Lingulodinium_polyedra.AAC.1